MQSASSNISLFDDKKGLFKLQFSLTCLSYELGPKFAKIRIKNGKFAKLFI